jgi:CubicO group peptidase (beta-lactamase class C family)
MKQTELRSLMKFARPVGLAAILCASANIAIADDESMRQQVKAYMDNLADQNKFSGAVLLAKGNNIIFQGAYGKQSIAYDRDNAVDTKFNLASVGRMFTGVAIAQHAERGLLCYDDLLITLRTCQTIRLPRLRTVSRSSSY